LEAGEHDLTVGKDAASNSQPDDSDDDEELDFAAIFPLKQLVDNNNSGGQATKG